jgi:formamidase
MFVSSEKFIEAHAGKLGDISIYGQESNYTTWRLAAMNLAIRGIDGQIAHGDTFHNDRHPDLKADWVLANPPFAATAHMGKLTGAARDAAAATGARTVPPREHGGNCDIKDLSRGSKIYFPVYVPGGGLSMGDLHFSQGDGEITFCGAIEMAGWLHLKVDIIKDGVAKYGIKNPIFKPSPITPNYKDYLIFEGISVDEKGEQHYLDVHIAYRQACLNAIEYLKKFGYSGAQAYTILGVAPVQGHISGVVDIPNACATLYLPTEIFDFDIMPSSAGPIKHIKGGLDVSLSPDK